MRREEKKGREEKIEKGRGRVEMGGDKGKRKGKEKGREKGN